MKIKIDHLKELENNPRLVNDGKLEQIKKSLKEFPKMLELRPIVINKQNQILGGNLRWRAAKELGWQEIDCVVLEDADKEYEFLIKDNLSYGDWNWSSLVEDYKSNILVDWGVNIPVWFKDLELSLEDKKPQKPQEEITQPEAKEKTFSSKKALYLFYTIDEKNELIERINAIRNDRSNEQVFMDLVKKYV